MLAENKAKRVAMIYLEKHMQVKEMVATHQVARKDHIGDQKLGFRCLFGITWVRRVMLTELFQPQMGQFT